MTTRAGSGPGFTVTIAVRNGAETLAAALDSLAAQTSDDFEIVVVDDGSTDGSGDVARVHPTEPLVLTTPGEGVAVARNLAAVHAHGRYLTWLDADDLFHPVRIETLAAQTTAVGPGHPVHTGVVAFALERDRAALEATGETGLLAWTRHWVDEPAALTGPGGPDPADPNDVERVARTHADLFEWVPPAQVLAVDRDLFIKAGCFPTHARAGSDYLFLFNLSRLTDIIEWPNDTYFYRLHPGSITRQTRIPWPLLTSLIAYRYGELHLPPGAARAHGHDAPPRNLVLEDQIAHIDPTELRRAMPELRHLIAALYPDPAQRRKLHRRLVSDTLATKFPSVGRARARRRARRVTRR